MRNLIYFIYFNGRLNNYHVINLAYIRKYWHLFNGEKTIKIAVDGNYSIKPISDILPLDAKFTIVSNSRILCESSHFIESLSNVNDGITFYAHCKGVSKAKLSGLDYWLKSLYETNLSEIPDLSEKLFSGNCGKLVACPPYVPFEFHYSGSFFWFNTSKVKERMKNVKIVPDRYFTERFPAIIANKSECEFKYPSSNQNLNFYEIKTWQNIDKYIPKDAEIRVHYITPARADKQYGKAINDIVKYLPDTDWICLRDIDTIPLNHAAMIPQVEAIIKEHGNTYDMFGAMTNDLGLNYQLNQGRLLRTYDLEEHRKITDQIRDEFGTQVEPNRQYHIGGFFMLFSKKIWDKVGGFVDEVYKNGHFFDYYFCKGIKKAGGKIGIAKGIYIYHYCRYGKERGDFKHLL